MSEPFTLPMSGEVVQLRGLTGYEVSLARKLHGEDEFAHSMLSLGWCMSDGSVKPDEAQAVGEAWARVHLAGDYAAAVQRGLELSGLADEAASDAYKSVPRRRRK